MSGIAILALDMATATGWALRDRDGTVTSGTQGFDLKRGESTGMRLLRFRRWLREMIWPGYRDRIELVGAVDVVAYEQPILHAKRQRNTSVAHNLEGVLLPELEARSINYTNVTPAALKKHATGKGNSGKPAMIAAAEARWGIKPADDNEADALCVLAWALDEIGEA